MSFLVAMVGFVAALGPVRQSIRLGGLSRTACGLAAMLTVLGLLATAALSGPLLNAGSVSAPTARIGAGLALAATCLLRLIRPMITADEGVVGELHHRSAALVPAAFPVLLQPVVVMLALAVGAERGALVAVGAAMPAVVLWLALAVAIDGDTLSDQQGRGGWRPHGTRLVATLGFPTAVAMMVGGVFAL